MNRPRAASHHAPRVWIGIAAAGGAGSLMRYLVTAGGGWGPIVIANVLGCAILGVLVARGRATPALAVGLCGGLTTFSGVAAQASQAARGDQVAIAGTGASHLVMHGLAPALLLLAVNAVAGLAAFAAARRAGGGPRATSTPPHTDSAAPVAAPLDVMP
jgi:fluoride ion exporter CrcB/FEX